MECKVKADPKPKIVWYRNNEIVNENNKIKMSVEQRGDHYYIKLEMIDPQIEDSGLYKCNIKNNLGELNANLTLNIESKLLNCKINQVFIYLYYNLKYFSHSCY